MNHTSEKLDQYPGLSHWFSLQPSSAPLSDDPVQHLVWNSCYALTLEQDASLTFWARTFKEFFEKSSEPLDDYLHADEAFGEHETVLLDFIGDIAEQAVIHGQSTLYFDLMSRTADQTGIVAYRFLAAWIAMNSEDLELCVQECEKVDEPYSALHTLHGQALLELHRAEEAIEVLEVAVSLSPRELLAWFQLAKAAHVSGDTKKAIHALEQSRRLAPQSTEVVLFYAMIALGTPDDTERAMLALELLTPHISDGIEISSVVCVYLDLAFLLLDRDAVRLLATKANWTSLLTDAYFVKNLSTILKRLHSLEWNKEASEILSHLTAQKKSA